MSFFEQLKSRTQAAQERKRAEDERRKAANIVACQRFSRAWVEKFKKVCQARADAGHAEASMELEEWEMPVLDDSGTWSMSKDDVAREVADCLRSLGGVVEVGNWRFHGGAGHCAMITAKWDQATAQAEATCKKRKTTCHARGHSSSCPICMETLPVVVLVPCGHAICGMCQDSHKFGRDLPLCPLCRDPVTGATKGLFLQ